MNSSPSFLRAWLGRFVIALIVATLVTFSGVLAVNLGIDREFSKIVHRDLKVDKPPEANAGNFLLIGSDSRQFVSDAQEQQAFGSKATETGQRSDTIMVVHVDPSTKRILLVSFPRDLLVNIPGVGRSKINAAFNYGPQKTIDTIQTNFGVPINHYLEVDFKSFQGIVDALGGVKLYFSAPARDTVTGLEAAGFGAGCYNLDGSQALAFVRSRHYQEYVNGRWTSDPTADIGRIKRQQDFMRTVAAEAARQASGSYSKAKQLADRALANHNLTSDANLGRGDILGLIGAFLDINPADPNQLASQTYPWKTGPSFQGQSVLYPDNTNPVAGLLIAALKTFGNPGGGAPEQSVVAPQSVKVRVLNGTTKVGLAANAIASLEKQGFVPSGTGDAPKQNTGATEVHYRPGAEDQAKLVKSYLGGVGTLVEDKSISSADVVLVLRYDFIGVSPPSSTTPPTTVKGVVTTAPPTTTAKGPKPATPTTTQSASC